MGRTSREKMEQMGIPAPIYGVLLEEMLIKDGVLDHSKLIHPKAEPEIAVLMKADVAPDASVEELEAAIGWMAPAIEVIDSRFKDFKFTMADVVADNCSSTAFAVGEWVPYPAEGVDIAAIQVRLVINGETKTEGGSSAVLGSPIASMRELAFTLADKGKGLRGLCAALGADLSETVAFGDNWNDAPMLEAAGTGYLMADVAPALREKFPNQCTNVLTGWKNFGGRWAHEADGNLWPGQCDGLC